MGWLTRSSLVPPAVRWQEDSPRSPGGGLEGSSCFARLRPELARGTPVFGRHGPGGAQAASRAQGTSPRSGRSSRPRETRRQRAGSPPCLTAGTGTASHVQYRSTAGRFPFRGAICPSAERKTAGISQRARGVGSRGRNHRGPDDGRGCRATAGERSAGRCATSCSPRRPGSPPNARSSYSARACSAWPFAPMSQVRPR